MIHTVQQSVNTHELSVAVLSFPQTTQHLKTAKRHFTKHSPIFLCPVYYTEIKIALLTITLVMFPLFQRIM